VKRRAIIVVSGMIAADPWQGGATWAVLQYVLGLARLGHEVYLVEPVASKALQPEAGTLQTSHNADYFTRVTAEFRLGGRAALLLTETRETAGLSYDQLLRVAKRADLLINISGMLTDEALLAPIPRRVYLDLDPAFNQLWHTVQGIEMRFRGHTHFVTVGLEIGQPRCPVPTCGLNWLTTLQPVVLESWPVAQSIAHDALTTVANWRGYGSIEHGGVLYGQKAHSWRPMFPLPTLTDEKFTVALAIHPRESADLAALARNGWTLLDPAQVADSPVHYQQFIQGSKAELGIAKSGYVLSRCGWFSDRSVCYLASGRPVIAQDTGFGRHLPTGEGLFSFNKVDEVLTAIGSLNQDYARHAKSARGIAEECFASDKVLGRLLERVGV
jgi:hypothetical protein